MNTGHGSKSHASETFPFAAEVYRTAEPTQRNGELEELRAEMRNEVRALRAHVTRTSGVLELGRELAAMRAALEEMAPAPAAPKRNDPVAAFLRARGIEGPAATRITVRAKESTEADLSTKMKAAIAEVVTLAPWNDQFEGRRIVAMVGPSGVGKTTTVAKLAAQARMNGKSVALVSCDGFRVGAVDQLERYADLLGATFHVARTAAELAAVLEEETADVVFVDTSGRPPTATAPEAALAARRKKGAPVPVEVILCVPASIRPHDAARVVGIFASLAPTAVCVTKLDETSSPSGLIHGPWAAKLPLAVICAGPRVPEDVSSATPEVFFAALGIEEPAEMSAALASSLSASRVLSTADYRKYLPIVRRTAMRLARKVPSHISVSDLTGYAWIGLVEAFARSGENMSEAEFEAYALYRIRGAMLDHLRSLDTASRTSRATSRKVTRAIHKLTQSLLRPPEEEEIAAELTMTVLEYRATLAALDRAGMNRLEMLDIDTELPADGGEHPEELAGRKEIHEAVAEAIHTLPERLQHVLALYYTEECTLREIGTILDVSESRVCQLHTEAVHRLRAAIGRE